MKKTLILTTIAAILLTTFSVVTADTKEAAPTEPVKKDVPAPKKSAFDNDTDKLSYAIGMNIGQSLNNGIKSGDIQINLPILFKAIEDVVNDKPRDMTQEEVQSTFMNLQKGMMERQAKIAKENLEKGTKYLAENAKKDGVKTTKSGLQYKIIKEGTGVMPKDTDMVKVNYRGTLVDGKEFDSSKPGQPAEFPVRGVIPGWSEALQLMKVGSKYELFIPANLGYGERGAPPSRPGGTNIQGNSTLVFEVELLEILKTPPTTGPAMRMPPGMRMAPKAPAKAN
ncbi:MAG: FKBP-type peptidyl-prolyl cis-trans isomerase [Phycisphaerae bacterium]